MSPCGRGGRRSKYWASSQREVSESERERKREKERQRERDTWEIDTCSGNLEGDKADGHHSEKLTRGREERKREERWREG